MLSAMIANNVDHCQIAGQAHSSTIAMLRDNIYRNGRHPYLLHFVGVFIATKDVSGYIRSNTTNTAHVIRVFFSERETRHILLDLRGHYHKDWTVSN